jgi:alpha-tubulin suppressor-like RCC1 family protein/fibrillarin-like rRNA methylase
MTTTRNSTQINFLDALARCLSARSVLMVTCLLIILTNVNVGHALVPLTGITKIATGNGHTCAVTTGGGVKCWGLNFFGQLGDNTNIYRSLPVDVIAGPSLPPLAGVTAISTGLNHTCVLINGGAKCWGDNAKGQLGDGSTLQRLTPVNVSGLGFGVVSIAAAASHTCALLSGGGVKCWGSNLPSRLGDNTVTQSSTPVDVLNGPGPTFPLLAGATLLAAGSQSGHTCAMVGSGISCWGSDVYGQLGVDMPLLGVSRVALPVVGLGGAASTLALGSAHTCAIIGGGVVQCWGNNDFGGQLGDNTLTNRRTPVNVVGLTSPVSAISAGSIHTCALTAGGGAKCWGNNNSGQLGDSSMMQRLTPVDVSGLTSGVSAIAAGGDHTCALTNAGGVKCWGFNGYGQLGDNTDVVRLAPVDVLTDATVPVTFTVAPSAGANGTISPNTPQVISAGSSLLFTVTPNAGFAASVGGTCGGTLVGTSYSTNAITANCTVVATFVPTTFTITPSAGADGTISPSTPQVISAGSSRLFTVTPSAGFAASVGGTCGGTLVGASYTTNAVTANCTVVVTFNKILRTTRDLNADGKSDLLVQSSAGVTTAWLMNGTTIASSVDLIGAASGWSISHVADFNGDGRADILWRHTDGRAAMWLMNGTTLTSGAGLIGAGAGWSVTHVADFDGDGKADILWRNIDGRVAMWLMNGTNLTSGAGLIGAASGWSVTHAGDFNGDGRADILWQNADGRVAMWLMNGFNLTSGGGLIGAASGWSVTHVGDFDGDGRADILWRNVDGRVAMWLMNGTNLTGGAGLIGAASGWGVSHVADFDGDGRADILWRNVDGRVAMWLMNGTNLTSGAGLIGAASGWSVTHTGDFNGDGNADIVYGHVDGRIAMWLMNGFSLTSGGGITGAGSGLVVVPTPP